MARLEPGFGEVEIGLTADEVVDEVDPEDDEDDYFEVSFVDGWGGEEGNGALLA